jgi:hypothetical protein
MDETISTTAPDSPRTLLEEAYRSLGYDQGSLLEAVSAPLPNTPEFEQWLEKGDWLALATKIGAQKVFFVNNDPVIVFCELNYDDNRTRLLDTFRQAWCMARPTCLFVALPGELRVYSLNRTPAKNDEEWARITPLAVAERAAEVAERLQAFRREEIESGRLFSEIYFGDIEERADRRLIRDLKSLRTILLEANLPQRYAHALIGRSIFVRYLEDRGVLLPTFFEQVANGHPDWKELLAQVSEKPAWAVDLDKRSYSKVLQSKDFTYAVFNHLSEHFNGDMFPRDVAEEEAVGEQQHLAPLRQFLLGEGNSEQQSLFFWAYDFEIVPVELISSIYEEFYHDTSDGEDDKGTHYTPSVLVDHVLARLLTKEKLAENPRVLDPACGSGIFLVEAFRRIVRFRVQERKGKPLSSEELRVILRDQIAGIELNGEATRVAAFSLYLALLHYQKPPDILAYKRLPNLIHGEESISPDKNRYDVLYNADTFGITAEEEEILRNKLNRKKVFAGRAIIKRLLEKSPKLKIKLHSSDVIVGNPPWDEPKKKAASSQDSSLQAQLWAKVFNLPVGDNSPSQLFMYRALSLVKPGGVIGLLVHSSVIFNQRETSRRFRQRWLALSKLSEIINFVHVRRLFFDKAVAPFVFVSFYPQQAKEEDHSFVYLSARLTKMAEETRVVVLSQADRRIVRQSDIQNRDYLWKTYWWGNHRDAALLSLLEAGARFQDVLREGDAKPQYGFQHGRKPPSDVLRNLPALNSKRLQFYGPLKEEWFEKPPTGIGRQPDERLYQDQRILVVRGIKAGYGAYARLEDQRFSFRHTIYCIPLPGIPTWQAKLILGVFWSSLGRYRMFMTAGRWGAWYDETVPWDILSMPIRIDAEQSERDLAVITAVDAIREHEFSANMFLSDGNSSNELIPPIELLQRLDNAVLDLFGLGDAERDLINDFIHSTFELFSHGAAAKALNPVTSNLRSSTGTINSLRSLEDRYDEIGSYILTFLEIWNREFEPEGELNWRVVRPAGVPMIASVFTTQLRDTLPTEHAESDQQIWKQTLEKCEAALRQPVSQRIYIEGMIRVVTDTFIIIIKRDERRLWTRSMAREDAEATLLQAVNLQEQAQVA